MANLRSRSLLWSGPAVIALGALTMVACSGQSQAPPTSTTALPCLVTLASDCCLDAGTPACVGDLTAAEHCGNWPTGAKVLVYTAPCDGYTAVSVRATGETFTSFYLYGASGALEVVGDNAQDGQPGATALECGAGPTNVQLETTCMTQWLDTSLGVACASGSATPKSICQ